MMKFKLRTAQTLALVTIPAFAGAIAALPGQAATFSLANTEVVFFNFSSPEAANVEVSASTETAGTVTEGQIASQANAEAGFQEMPPFAGNFTNSSVTGSGTNYFVTAESEASVKGQFAVQSLFSFNFQALFNLSTSVDDASIESANASGNILFQLFDSTNPDNLTLLDSFSISGLLNSANSNDLLDIYVSPYISLSPNSSLNSSFGGNQESAIVSVEGVYARTFAKPLSITLVESKSSYTNASAVPEPFTVFGTIIGLGGGVVLKRRKAIAAREE